jgi:hypothetical protein
MTHIAEPMTLAQVSDSLRKRAKAIRDSEDYVEGITDRMADWFDVRADAIDAELAKQREAEPVAVVIDLDDEDQTGNFGLDLLGPEMAVHGARFIEIDGNNIPKTRPLSLSRERVSGNDIRQGDESVPYSLVAWTASDETHPQQRNAVEVTDEVRTVHYTPLVYALFEETLRKVQAPREAKERLDIHWEKDGTFKEYAIYQVPFNWFQRGVRAALSAVASRDREDAELTDDEADHLVARVMDSIAAKRAMHALDLSPDITMHHELRREIVRAARRENKP